MILHIPEGIVPFSDSGCARTPLYCYTGQSITIDCLTDSAVPRLEIDGIDFSGKPVRTQKGWRFTLPAFSSPISLRYRFIAEQETSRWFPLDILKRVIIQSPLKTGEGWIQLYNNIYLAFEKHATGYYIRMSDRMPIGTPYPGGITFGESALFTVSDEGKTVVQCTRMSLALDKDGHCRLREYVLTGQHKHVFGTGERFDNVDQNGRESIGQVVEHFTKQNNWSYMPSPMFLTDGGFGFYYTGAANAGMRFLKNIHVSCPEVCGKGEWILLGTPGEQLQGFLSLSGECTLPPKWAFGLWISANGWKNDQDVDEQLRMLEKHNCPASVMVLEAWSDESTFYRWSRAWKNPEATVRRIRAAGLHLILWQIPVIKAVSDCPDPTPVKQDLQEAIEKGYLIRHTDGSPYVIPDLWFKGSHLPDFTNPETCKWWFEKRDHLLEAGVEGFKTDGGEFLFGSDFIISDGTKGIEAHNLFPNQYIRAYNDWMKSKNIPGVTFSRAGYAGMQGMPIHWAGDQLSTWSELKAQLTAGLSASLSGVIFWSFDIGGFAGKLPEAELYLRATAFGCFCPIMQWHAEPRGGQFYETEGEQFVNDRSPWNLADKLGDPSITDIACRFARIRETLRPYLWEEARHCVNDRRPMMAHLAIDYPKDLRALNTHDEYMLGRKYLIAPITDRGASGRKVYLPEGLWKHFFTGRIYLSGMYDLECPIDEALVFEKMPANDVEPA